MFFVHWIFQPDESGQMPLRITKTPTDRTNFSKTIIFSLQVKFVAAHYRFNTTHCNSICKLRQDFSATYCNIVGRNMLRTFNHPVATDYDMLDVVNWSSAHARTQHCSANLSKQLQVVKKLKACRMKKRLKETAEVTRPLCVPLGQRHLKHENRYKDSFFSEMGTFFWLGSVAEFLELDLETS